MVFLLVAVSVPGRLQAAGFQLFNEMSARGTGMGGAMTAVGDRADTAWFNPAAVALMDEPMIQAGIAVVVPSMKLDGPGYSYDMKNMAYPVPNFYATIPYGDRLGFSLAINVPYGLTTEWDWGWPGEVYAKKTDLRCTFLTPSVSVKLNSWLALGIGAQISRADAEMNKAIPDIPAYGAYGLRTTIKGDDTSKGYVLSLLATPFKDWRLGAVFRSHVKFHVDGDATYNKAHFLFQPSAVNLPLALPASLSLGVSTTAVKGWLFSFDYLWTWWSYYRSLDFYYDKTPGLGTPGLVSYRKEWDDCYALRFGAEYTLDDNWRIRGSYVLDQSPIDDRYRDPSLPTNTRHLFSMGAGYSFRDLEVDLAYTYLKMEDSSPSQATPLLSGTYEGNAHIFNLSASWTF